MRLLARFFLLGILVVVPYIKAENYTVTPEYSHHSDASKARCYAVAFYGVATKMLDKHGEQDSVAGLKLGSGSLKFSDIAFDVYAGVNGLSTDANEIALQPFYKALNAFTINFESRSSKIALVLGASKKIMEDSFEVGFQVPFEHIHHNLKRSFGGARDYSRWVALYNATTPGAYSSVAAPQGRVADINNYLDKPTAVPAGGTAAGPNVHALYQKDGAGNPTGVPVKDLNYPYNSGKYFSSVYYEDLSLVLDTFLTKKNLEYKENQSITGVGNIGLYAQMFFEPLVVGVKIDLPSSRVYPDALWKPEVGNGGFFARKLFSSYAIEFSDKYTPHIYAELTAYASVRKSVRLSQSYRNGNTMKVPLLSQPYYMSEQPALPVNSLSGSEVQQVAFASDVVVARVRKGPEFSCLMGNVINGFIFSGDKLDVTYTFYIMASDGISGNLPAGSWDTAGFKENTSASSHKLGLLWTFYEQEAVKVEAGGSYVVAGKNVEQRCDLRLRLEYEF